MTEQRNFEKLKGQHEGTGNALVSASTEVSSVDTLPQGQSSKSPAFSFYAKEFLAATLAWALDARGAYVTLLAYQWDAGSVPANDMSSLGRVLGISSTKARLVWTVIGDKFQRGADGQWRNVRLEQERQKQLDRRNALRENGSKGGRPKNQQVNQTETNRLSTDKPKENLNESLSSSFSFTSSGDSKNESRKQQPRATLIKSPAYVEKRLQTCAFVGAKIEVPLLLHFELRGKHGGTERDAETALQAWYLELDAEAEQGEWSVPVDNKFFPWFKALYAQKFATPAINGVKSINDEIDEWAKS